MYHHDSRDYDVAASEAAAKGRVKMEEIIHRGREAAGLVVEQVQGRVIYDAVAPAPAARLDYTDGERVLVYGDNYRRVHDHAFGQMIDTAKIGRKFVNDVIDESSGSLWGKDLVAHNFNTIMAHRRTRHLIRAEGESGPVMGFLSDKFKRLDERPMLDSFIGACREIGLVPIDGVASDTKCRLRAVLPEVFEPVPNEVMIFGAEYGNSNYGDGGVVVNLWTMRVWCTNTAVVDKCLRQVHLSGHRLPDDIRLSERTLRLDTEALQSKVHDVVAQVVGPERVNGMLEAIRAASEEEVRGREGVDKILQRYAKGLAKGDADAIKGLYDGPDVVNIPPGENVWRLSNAVSWFATTRGVDPDRRLELQDIAGRIATGRDAEKSALSV